MLPRHSKNAAARQSELNELSSGRLRRMTPMQNEVSQEEEKQDDDGEGGGGGRDPLRAPRPRLERDL